MTDYTPAEQQLAELLNDRLGSGNGGLVDAEIEYQRSDLLALARDLLRSQWQPIATAPKDNKRALDLWVEWNKDSNLSEQRGRLPNCVWSERLQCWWWLHGYSEHNEGHRVHGIVTHYRYRPEPPTP